MKMLKMHILKSLKDRLTGPLGAGCAGALCGLQVDGVPTVIAAITHHHKAEGKAQEIRLLNEVLPCGMEPVGVFDCSDSASEESLLSYLDQLPPLPEQDQIDSGEMREEQRVAIFKDSSDTLKGFLYVDGKLKPAEIEVISEDDLEKETILIRVRGKMDFTCGFTKEEMSATFKHLIEKVTCPYGTYTMEGDQIVILHKFIEKELGSGWSDSATDLQSQFDEDCVLIGPVDQNDPVENLWKYSEPVQQADGFGVQEKKSIQRRDKLEFNLVWNLTNPACTHRTIGCAPIINYEKRTAKTIRVPIIIDALGIVDKRSLVKDLPHVLKGCVARQLGDMAASVLSEFSLRNTVSTPQVHHFKAEDLPHLITIIYPKSSETDSFREFRKNMHVNFMLPLDRPLFRKSNEISWNKSGDKKALLLNVHTGILDKHGIPGALVASVQGNYAYHHYMQDDFNDDGWGCAYRSLQTLVSWLRLQGHTEATVPSHKEIQQTLIDIGDKERKFLNSKQWIGSMEVGFVLETRCNINSRYISVSSGADMASKAEDLIEHFQTEGTPIMIGGGVYAHTILGVAYDEPAEKCSWLILDPHYTGAEDLKTIISKGWCGWKGPNFWNKTAFYNMCLPMRPKNAI